MDRGFVQMVEEVGEMFRERWEVVATGEVDMNNIEATIQAIMASLQPLDGEDAAEDESASEDEAEGPGAPTSIGSTEAEAERAKAACSTYRSDEEEEVVITALASENSERARS